MCALPREVKVSIWRISWRAPAWWRPGSLIHQKAALIEESMAPLRCTNMKALVLERPGDRSAAMAKADIVIADLPCSGLGIIGKPDIKLQHDA